MPRKNYKWAVPAVRRRECMLALIRLANRLRVEAVFPQDYKDVALLDEAVKIMQSYSLQPYNGGKCPICDSPSVTEGILDDVCFEGIGAAPKWLGKMEGLVIRHCDNCGAYNIVGW